MPGGVGRPAQCGPSLDQHAAHACDPSRAGQVRQCLEMRHGPSSAVPAATDRPPTPLWRGAPRVRRRARQADDERQAERAQIAQQLADPRLRQSLRQVQHLEDQLRLGRSRQRPALLHVLAPRERMLASVRVVDGNDQCRLAAPARLAQQARGLASGPLVERLRPGRDRRGCAPIAGVRRAGRPRPGACADAGSGGTAAAASTGTALVGCRRAGVVAPGQRFEASPAVPHRW